MIDVRLGHRHYRLGTVVRLGYQRRCHRLSTVVGLGNWLCEGLGDGLGCVYLCDDDGVVGGVTEEGFVLLYLREGRNEGEEGRKEGEGRRE